MIFTEASMPLATSAICSDEMGHLDPSFLCLPQAENFSLFELRRLGRQPYRPVFEAMKAFTRLRKQQPDLCLKDQLWVVEHEPVYTLGQSTRPEHYPVAGSPGEQIEIVSSDRGGQITYHGPGQVVLYYLLDLTKKKRAVRWLVSMMENLVIDFLQTYRIHAVSRPDAPGVYVNGEKIAALGTRISRGCSYHGLSFNVQMDLSPFNWINPCGYRNMPVTQLDALIELCDFSTIEHEFVRFAIHRLREHYD